MILPIRTDSPLRSTPWANLALIFLNIAVFMVQRRFPQLTMGLALHPRDPYLVDYFTYAFGHASLAHLLGNMLFLYIFGNNVNDKVGNVGYVGFYLAGAVFAGVGHTLAEASPVVGASGAVAAVTGAYLALFPRSSVTLIYVLFFVGTLEVPSLWFVALFFLKDFVMAVAHLPSDTAHVAHLSGAAFGFGVSLALLAAHLLPRDQFDLLALIQRWNRRRQYRDMVSKGYDPFRYVPQSHQRPGAVALLPDEHLLRIQDLRAEINEALAHHNHPHAALKYLELKKVDSDQVLSRQAQLDVANQLASQQRYQDAAQAYEEFLTHYRNFEQLEQVELMLGLIYARYLKDHDRGKEILLRALARLHGEREISMARAELARIDAAEQQQPQTPGGVRPHSP